MSKRYVWLLVVGCLLVLGAPRPVYAHPADMYTQTYALHLTPAGVTVTYTLSPGPVLAATTWFEADVNGDDVVDGAEAANWLAVVFAKWQSSLGGEELVWETTAVSWPTNDTAFGLGDAVITAERTASFSGDVGAQSEFSFHSTYAESISLNWFYVTGDGVSFDRPLQENGNLTVPLSFSPETAALTYWDSGSPSLVASSGLDEVDGEEETAVPPTVQPTPAAPVDKRPYARLTDLIRQQEMTFAFLVTAFAVALVLGAMHGLTPGHGKALVAAYLVGTRGTIKHAVALGAIVTLTHTGSVLLLGMITMAASRYFIPTDLFPILEIASGLLIIGLGISLLVQRWRGWRSVQRKREREGARSKGQGARGKGQGRIPQSPIPNPQSPNKKSISIGARIPVRVYDDALAADEAGGVRWRSLAALGISGGLVPCPDAIAILLVAVAINRIVLGISMIVSFSVGLVAVLIGIGMTLVQSRRLLVRFGQVDRYAPAISVASAVIVLALGVGLTWQAWRSTESAAQSELAETAEMPIMPTIAPTPTLPLEQAYIIYLVVNDQGINQLYSVPLAGGEPEQLTDAPFGILDYAVAPDGKTAVYTQIREDRGSDFWLLDENGRSQLLLECPGSICRNPTIAPNGKHMVYEKVIASQDIVYGTTTLWQLDLTVGETGPVFQDGSIPGFSPDWSANGQWLSYVVPGMPSKIQVYNLVDARRHEFPTMTSMAAIWQPTGESLLMVDVDTTTLQAGSQAYTHLLRFDLDREVLTDLSGTDLVSNGSPAWSPDGQQIAFLRRMEINGRLERGNQIWVMNGDGGEKRPLTATSNTLHQNLVWSENGRFLLYQQYNLDTPLARPSIWLMDTVSRETKQITDTGSHPNWFGQKEHLVISH